MTGALTWTPNAKAEATASAREPERSGLGAGAGSIGEGVEAMGRAYYTIAESDVGKHSIRAFGQTWPVSAFLGRVLAQDVGKRAYLIRGLYHLQVENDEQRAARQGRS